MVALIPGLLVSAVYFGLLFLHDRRTLGHLHKASYLGAAFVVAVQILTVPLGNSALWMGIMGCFAGIV